MNAVVIYRLEARFTGNPSYEFTQPEIGATHKCLLFMAQQTEEGQYEAALNECLKFGFSDIIFGGHGTLQPGVLDTEEFKGFSGHYEEALNEGSSLIFYPNA